MSLYYANVNSRLCLVYRQMHLENSPFALGGVCLTLLTLYAIISVTRDMPGEDRFSPRFGCKLTNNSIILCRAA
jgi:hypothetical protein